MGRREEYIRNLNVTRDDIQKMEYAPMIFMIIFQV